MIKSARSSLMLVGVGLLAALWGCSGASSTIKNHQIMQAILKEQALQAQRTVADLRAEHQTLQRELGTARTAQARMEGQLRETERRLEEARRVVELQREELARAKDERDELTLASRRLQAPHDTEHANLQQTADAMRQRLELLETAIQTQTHEVSGLKATVQESLSWLQPASATPARPGAPTPMATKLPGPFLVNSAAGGTLRRRVTVQRGDTLWALARKYGVGVAELKAINSLTTDLILPEQILVLPENLHD